MTGRRRLRIAFLVAGLESGGSERQMLAIAAGLPKDRFDVDFILFATLGPHAREARAAGLRIIPLELGHRRDTGPLQFTARLFRMVFHYIGTVRRRRYDIVDAWLYHAYVLAAVCRPIAGPRVLLSGRRSLSDFKDTFGLLPRVLDSLARRQSKLLVANALAVRDDVVARERVDPRAIRVIRNGVELPKPMAAAARAVIRRRWGIDDDALVAGCVANLKRGKGLEALVGIARDLQGDHPDLQYVVIGEGYLRPELEELISAAGVAERFHLVGWEEDARAVYGALDMVVQVSETEGLPNVLLEAAAAGRPIVATAAGGTPEIIIDGKTGLLVPVGDGQALRDAIALVARDPSMRRRLGAAAREHVGQAFGMDRLIAETAALYEELAGTASS